uniref:NADH-ubiquinone oxidoreductase chain 4L n=1 Tax=Philaenus spumarius TaxID=36667 RepID=Q6IT27_PHISP|nr:NADH dehydrogenase subunit 4L [Philaenus spumarius]AAT39440.1 NADH dehydrogenase subunit 4L [Philaenus spumarius]
MNFFIIYMYMYIIGLWTLCSIRKHILLCLLSLEFIVLSLFLMLYFYLVNFNYELYFSMIYLSFSVCEGVLGLSVLVAMVRSHGNDYLNSFNSLLC